MSLVLGAAGAVLFAFSLYLANTHVEKHFARLVHLRLCVGSLEVITPDHAAGCFGINLCRRQVKRLQPQRIQLASSPNSVFSMHCVSALRPESSLEI